MATFEYEVIERSGKVVKGEREAPTAEALQANLVREGLFVINIRKSGRRMATLARPGEGGGSPLWKAWTDALEGLTRRVKITDLVLFTGQLAAMIDAGLHLLRSLAALAEETRVKHFKAAIEQVASDVAGGQSLAKAIEKHPHTFNRFYVSLTRAGESSGRLPEVLNQLAIYLEKVAQLRRKIAGALSYPLVILSFAMLILSAVVFYVVPIFEGVYRRMNATLPLPTQMLIAVSRGVRSNIPLTLLVVIGIGVLIYLWVRTDSGRRRLDRCKLHLPLFGPLIRKAAIAKVCRTLSTLLTSGLPVLEALEITASVAGNRVIEDAIRRTAGEIEEGGTIASSFRRSGEFPSMVTQMVATGEETGKLPELLNKIALYYEQQVDSSVTALASLIEPVMIVVVGAISGAIIIALYLPIFNLGHAIRGGGS